jgi:hypothetical protein
MKTKVDNITAVLAYELELLRSLEVEFDEELSELRAKINDAALRAAWESYMAGSEDRRLKIKRIFGYLLTGPFDVAKTTAKAVNRNFNTICRKASGTPRDLLLATELMNSIQYKIAAYNNIQLMVDWLEMRQVSQLLSDIIQTERDGLKMLVPITRRHWKELSNSVESVVAST